jgi:hypothetical protein
MSQYDIPASLDYITNLTGKQKVAYIGHSQGTTQMFYGLSELESYYKNKLSIFVALAPVTMIPNTEAEVFKIASAMYDEIDDTLNLLNIHSVLNNTWYTSATTKLFCNAIPSLCLALEGLFVSSNPDLDD